MHSETSDCRLRCDELAGWLPAGADAMAVTQPPNDDDDDDDAMTMVRGALLGLAKGL